MLMDIYVLFKVMRAINGSTASSTSLNTVGNGVIKPSPIKANPALEAGLETKKAKNVDTAKTVDTSKSGKQNKNVKDNSGKDVKAVSDKDTGLRKHESKLGIANLGTGGTIKDKVGKYL